MPVTHNSTKKNTCTRLTLAISACLVAGLALAVPVLAEDEMLLKPAVPKMDQATPDGISLSRPQEVREQAAKKSALKGGVEHTTQYQEAPRRRLQSNLDQSGLLGAQQRARTDRMKARANQMNLQTQRSIGIIGVKFVIAYGHPPVINRVFPGTPAAGAGLRTNDVIVAIDGVPTYGLTKEECYDLIVGTPNTPVTLSVQTKQGFEVKTMNRMDFNDLTDPAVRRDYLMSI